MATWASFPVLQSLARILAWRRLVRVMGIAALLGLIISPGFTTTPAVEVMGREMVVGLCALLAFGILERWPAHLPRWLARWVLQVVGVALSIPLSVLTIYLVITRNDAVPLWQNTLRLNGIMTLTFTGLLLAPWIAVTVLFRQRDDAARGQALAFELERSELERKALDSRLRLLQAQVEPHFLFNTLANVQALVDAGSPQASQVLQSLIAYLRAAVPRLHAPSTTLGEELQLVRAYLEVMHMRMPDRLQFALQIDEAAKELQCPPMTLLTLVENAVRHGIDPGEEGGFIDIQVRLREGLCCVRVTDTGVGLQPAGNGLGTGLASLRERLQLAFGGSARLHLSEVEPHGVSAELEFPARKAAA